MFKSLIPAVVIVSALAAPTFAFAQSTDNNGPLTRAEVKAQLVQLEKAGYNPAGDQIDYPANIQAAQARVDAENGRAATSYGPSTSGQDWTSIGIRSGHSNHLHYATTISPSSHGWSGILVARPLI